RSAAASRTVSVFPGLLAPWLTKLSSYSFQLLLVILAHITFPSFSGRLLARLLPIPHIPSRRQTAMLRVAFPFFIPPLFRPSAHCLRACCFHPLSRGFQNALQLSLMLS
ncbi:unnamed protein product, partial [Phaeothamnion confervicola]